MSNINVTTRTDFDRAGNVHRSTLTTTVIAERHPNVLAICTGRSDFFGPIVYVSVVTRYASTSLRRRSYFAVPEVITPVGFSLRQGDAIWRTPQQLGRFCSGSKGFDGTRIKVRSNVSISSLIRCPARVTAETFFIPALRFVFTR